MILELVIPSYIYDIMKDQINIVSVFFATFIAIGLINNFFNTTLKSNFQKIFDTSSMFRYVVLIGLLYGSPYFIQLFVKLFDLVEKAVIGDANMSDIFLDEKYNPNKDLNVFEMFNVVSIFLSLITMPLCSIIRTISMIVIEVSLQIFICLIPYAVLMSLLPTFENVLKAFIKTILTLLFAGIVFNIMDLISLELVLSENIIDTVVETNNSGDPTMSLKYNFTYTKILVMIVMYCLPIWFSGKIMGDTDAGRILSTTSAVVTALATKGSNIASKVGSKIGNLIK